MTLDDQINQTKKGMRIKMVFAILFSGFGFFGAMVFPFDDWFRVSQIILMFVLAGANTFLWIKARNKLYALEKEAKWR